MEYWTCILGGGTPYSYCGIHAHDVCCFVPVNAEPVGILPTPSHSRCGKKGQDSGRHEEYLKIALALFQIILLETSKRPIFSSSCSTRSSRSSSSRNFKNSSF